MCLAPDKKKVPKYFVATTALEEFWDTSYPIVFLGEWCKRYSRRSYFESIRSETLPSPIQENELFLTINYLKQAYERVLPVLAQTLNNIHGVNFSTRYWRIVIGPWLLFYLHTLYDKYAQIINLRKNYPDFISICLEKSCFVVPENTLVFSYYMFDDPYNLQLYSQVFNSLGYKFSTKKMTINFDPEINMANFVSPKTSIKSLVWLFFDLIDKAFPHRRKIVFETVYFQKIALARLMLKMKGRFWPYIESYRLSERLPVNSDMRNKIADIKFGDNEYERMLFPLISAGLPKSMLEGFFKNRANIKQKCLQPPKAIMSAIGWYFNEEFKMYSAECAESGSILLGVQHGGGYGSLEYLFIEDYELNITDKFFSWGWTRNDCHAKVEPVTATKLVKTQTGTQHKKSNEILYVTDYYSRFLLVYPLNADFWKDSLEKQSIFLTNLSKGVKDRLVIRPSRYEGGLDFKERFRSIIPDVRIDAWDIPFSERDYGLLICDHPFYSTTIIESFVNNKPTILFASPHFAANCFNKGAKKYWDKLKDIGVFYEDPVDAARSIEAIYNNIDDWWNEPKRQEGIKYFLTEFGKNSPQWDKEWAQVLEKVLND
jgi:putative transferase (TIGR04331 family)